MSARRSSENAFKLVVTATTGRPFVPFLRQHLRRAHALLSKQAAPNRRLPLRELTVVLVNDSTMSDLHHDFLGIGGTTDVLTFPIDADELGQVSSGEVYVCVPEARRQAKLRGVSTKLELLLYALHGMLHLLGHDDRTDRAYRLMHRTEDQILTQLKLGPVFDRPTRLARPRRPRTRTRSARGGSR